MAHLKYPLIELIGTLDPELALLGRALTADFQVGEFTCGTPYPESLGVALGAAGLEFDDHGMGMLFASNHGVSLHTDEHPAVLWVLGGSINQDQTTHQLLVGNKSHTLGIGQVLLFDARKLHGVIAAATGLWVVFSSYVRRTPAARAPRLAKQPSPLKGTL